MSRFRVIAVGLSFTCLLMAGTARAARDLIVADGPGGTPTYMLLERSYGIEVPDCGHAVPHWTEVMDASAELYDELRASGHGEIAPYAVSMAYRIRFYMHMNAREAMHLIELRTAPQGHPAYRRICQAMHRLIAEQAGHRLIADAMMFADHSKVELERLRAERAAEQRRSRA